MRHLWLFSEFRGSSTASDHSISLFPFDESDGLWSIPKEKQSQVTQKIILIRDALASFVAKEIYSPRLGYKPEACEALFLNFGSLIAFTLFDRIFRINRLRSQYRFDEILLPSVNYVFNREIGYDDFYYNEVELNPVFNQWIINSILCDSSQKPYPNEKIQGTKQDRWRYLENSRELPNSKIQVILDKLKKLLKPSDVKYLLYRRYFNLKKSINNHFKKITIYLYVTVSKYGGSIAWTGSGGNGRLLMEHPSLFLWPYGPCSILPQLILRSQERVSIDINDFEDAGRFLEKLICEFLNSLDEGIYLSENEITAASNLFFLMLPKMTVEWAGVNCEAAIQQLKNTRCKYLFLEGTYASHEGALRVFAARELGMEIIGAQHSAWGGYLANGPLVTEILIQDCDYYLTYGWGNQPEDGSCWSKGVTAVPSPLLSELSCFKAKTNKPCTPNMRVLLSLGFLYRFPAIYNSSLRFDTKSRWISIIEETLATLVDAGYKVDIKMYDRLMADEMDQVLNKWMKISPKQIEEFQNHNLRIRDYMQTIDFDFKYDAIVWDLPAGGFSEAIAMKKNTFALWSEEIHLATSEGQPFLSNLLKSGVLFGNGADLVKSLNKVNEKDNWLYSGESKKSIDDFMNKFLITSDAWPMKWVQALNKYR